MFGWSPPTAHNTCTIVHLYIWSPPTAHYICTIVQLYICTVVQLHISTFGALLSHKFPVVQLHCCTVVQCTVVLLYSCITAVQLYNCTPWGLLQYSGVHSITVELFLTPQAGYILLQEILCVVQCSTVRAAQNSAQHKWCSIVQCNSRALQCSVVQFSASPACRALQCSVVKCSASPECRVQSIAVQCSVVQWGLGAASRKAMPGQPGAWCQAR